MILRQLAATFIPIFCLATPVWGQSTDAISREFSVYVYNGGGATTSDAVAREFSVYVYDGGSATISDAVAREFSVFTCDDTTAAPSDAVSREFGVYVGLVPACIARQWYTGRQISIQPSAVTAKFRGSFYIESLDRVAGIMVKSSEAVSIGSLVTVTGITDVAANYERCILAESVTIVGSGSVAPLGVRPGAIGGGDYFYSEAAGTGQKGLHAWNWNLGLPEAVLGLNNIGLLVTTWGIVTWASTNSFILDDGSGSASGDPTAPGVMVQLPFGVLPPPVGRVVSVTGICSCYKSSELLYRIILVRSGSDVRY